MMSAPLQRVWVVGSGLLGSATLRAARAAGMQTLSIDAAAPADVQGPAQSAETLARAREMLEPQAVICCAATHGGSVEAYRGAYSEVAERVAAELPQAKAVFCSSSAVYEGRGGSVSAEDSPTPGSTEKLRVLLRAEETVLRAGGCVARMASLYGEGRCELLRRHIAGEPQLPGESGRMLNYVHADDAARALLLLAQLGATGVFNVCAETFSKQQAYAMLEAQTGRPAASHSSEARVGRGRADHCVSSARLIALGWRPLVKFSDFAARYA